LDAPTSAVIGVPGKGERCGSKGACAPLDSANGFSLRLNRAPQGRATPHGAASAVLVGA
jgi:hypothetical protein